MFVKKVFFFLLTIGIANCVNSIGVQASPPDLKITVNSSGTLPSSTLKPPDVITAFSNQTSVTLVTLSPEVETSSPTHEPVLLNHNRTDETTTVPTTLKPSSTTTVQMIKTTAHDVLPDTSEHVDHVMTTAPISSTVNTETTTKETTSLPMEKKDNPTKTTAAGIVALACVGIVSVAFAALFAWRYVYRRRHGNREILINEEDVDFNDEDLRHFEATCIQLEPDA